MGYDSDAEVDLDIEYRGEGEDGHGSDNDPADEGDDGSGAQQDSDGVIASASDYPTHHDALYSTNDEGHNASSSIEVEGLQADPGSAYGDTNEHTMDGPLQDAGVGGEGTSGQVVESSPSAHEVAAGNEVSHEHNGAGEVSGDVADTFMTKAEGKKPARF